MVAVLTGKTIIISNQPYFYKKAELFPGSAFVIGADTVIRLINVRYLATLENILYLLDFETTICLCCALARCPS